MLIFAKIYTQCKSFAFNSNTKTKLYHKIGQKHLKKTVHLDVIGTLGITCL